MEGVWVEIATGAAVFLSQKAFSISLILISRLNKDLSSPNIYVYVILIMEMTRGVSMKREGKYTSLSP